MYPTFYLLKGAYTPVCLVFMSSSIFEFVIMVFISRRAICLPYPLMGLGFRVWGLGFGVLRFMVLGFTVLGFRVLGFRV